MAIEMRVLEIKLRERMRAIDDRLNPMPSRHLTDRFDRSDLPGEIDLMRNLDQPSTRCDRTLERRGDLLDVLWRNGNLDQVELDAFAQFALTNRRQHPAIVLRRR